MVCFAILPPLDPAQSRLKVSVILPNSVQCLPKLNKCLEFRMKTYLECQVDPFVMIFFSKTETFLEIHAKKLCVDSNHGEDLASAMQQIEWSWSFH